MNCYRVLIRMYVKQLLFLWIRKESYLRATSIVTPLPTGSKGAAVTVHTISPLKRGAKIRACRSTLENRGSINCRPDSKGLIKIKFLAFIKFYALSSWLVLVSIVVKFLMEG